MINRVVDFICGGSKLNVAQKEMMNEYISQLTKSLNDSDRFNDQDLYEKFSILDAVYSERIPKISELYEEVKVNGRIIERNLKAVLELLKSYINDNDKEISENIIGSNKIEREPLIFLSHSSKDRINGHALRNLIMDLGVKQEQLIYTTHELHRIPLDENIFDYLRKNIHRDIFLIILWSDDYLESPACLNEMGAGWVTQCDYSNIYVPEFNFDNPKYHQCVVDTKQMGIVLNGDKHCKMNLIDFINKILLKFELLIDEQIKVHLMDSFIEEIKLKSQEDKFVIGNF